MKWVLGNKFSLKSYKFFVPAYNYKVPNPKEKNKNLTIPRTLSFHNLYVYAYTEYLYPFLYRFIFLFSSFINRWVAKAAYAAFATGVVRVVFNTIYSFFVFFVYVFGKYVINTNSLRFLFYLLMVHMEFRRPDLTLRDFVARRLKLTTNNKQPFLDYLSETIINSYLNFDTTDIKYDYWANKKRKFLSFFLLYQEKSSVLISNKDFLEKWFLFINLVLIKDKYAIEQHRRYTWNRLTYLFYLFQRPSFYNTIRFFFFIATKVASYFFLLIVIPFLSLITQLFVVPFVRACFYFFYLTLSFTKQLFASFFYFLNFFLNLISETLDFFRLYLFVLRNRSKKLSSTITLYFNRLKRNKKQRISLLKLILLPFYRISLLIPSKDKCKKIFMEQIVRRTIEPTLQNGDDGFLFVHRQNSKFNGKSHMYMDSQLLELLLTRQEIVYWDCDPVEDDYIGPEAEQTMHDFLREDLNPSILEQDDTDVTDDDEEDGEDFWLVYNNYNEYDVLADFDEVFNSLWKIMMSIPILCYVAILLSVFNHLIRFYYRIFLQFFYHLDLFFLYDKYDSYRGNEFHKMVNFIAFLGLCGYGLMKGAFLEYPQISGQSLAVVATVQGIFLKSKITKVSAICLVFFWYLYLLWYLAYLSEHAPSETNEYVEEEAEDTAYLNEDFEDNEEDAGLLILAYLAVDFSYMTIQELEVYGTRHIEQWSLQRNHNWLDILNKICSWFEGFLVNAIVYFEYLLHLIIS